jgi:hypothetical protein
LSVGGASVVVTEMAPSLGFGTVVSGMRHAHRPDPVRAIVRSTPYMTCSMFVKQ